MDNTKKTIITDPAQLTLLSETGVDATDENPRGFCPCCGIYLDNGTFEHDPANGYKCEERRYSCMGCGGEWGPLLRKRQGVTHAGKTGKRNAVSVKQWLKTHKDATYAEALEYVLSTGRSETTLKIQSSALGISLKK